MKQRITRVSTLFLILLSVFPQIYLLMDTIGCKAGPSLPLWILLLCVLTWIAACYRRGILVGMPLAALSLYVAYQYLGPSPGAQLNDFFDRITGVYYEHFYAPGSVYSFLNAVNDHSLVLVFLAFLLAAYMASSLTTRSGRILMSLMGTAPLFLACVSANGTPPYWTVLAMLLFWVLLLVSGKGYDPDNSDGKAVLALSVPVLLLLCAVLWLCHPDRYEISDQDMNVSRHFDRISSALSRWIGGDENRVDYPEAPPSYKEDSTPEPTEKDRDDAAPWHSSSGGMDLTKPFDSELAEKRILRVRSDVSAVLYLRTLSYGDYLGTGWAAAEESAPFSSLGLTADAVAESGTPRRLSVRPDLDLGYQCVPYYSRVASERDSFVPFDGRNSYTLEFFRLNGGLASLALPDPDQAREPAYAEYAHAVYTRLPEETRSAMLAYCAQQGIDASSPDLITRVATLIQSSGTYDLETQNYPSSDYAIHFLTQAKHGYCIHFATAAAVMYRSLGLPARITEGFLVDLRADRETEVMGANAHAWVEVYRDGLGWIPVEVTGRSGPAPAEVETPENGEKPEPGNDESSDRPVPAPAEEGSPENESGQIPVGVIKQEENGEDASAASFSGLSRLLRLILITVLLLSLLPLWRLLVRLSMRAQLDQRDGRRAAIAIWRIANRVSRFGAEAPFALRNTAEKASFSRHSISREELEQCRALLREMVEEVYPGLKPWKKFLFKYLYGLK